MKLIHTHIKKISTFMLLSFVIEILSPLQALALTGGPSQPEVQGFKPVGASDMVNLFSGDFSYNIPLLDVGGYPINLSYNSGISNDQEASWVGLGWNINPGAINRAMRGLPDEFKGDKVRKQFNMKRNWTATGTFKPMMEFFGMHKSFGNDKKFGASLNGYSVTMKYNSYNGWGLEPGFNVGLSTQTDKGSLNAGLGLKSTSNGLSISPSISFEKQVEKNVKGQKKPYYVSHGLSTSYNSLSGFSELTINRSISEKIGAGRSFKGSGSGGISIGIRSYTPTINIPMANFNGSFTYRFGTAAGGILINSTMNGTFSEQHVNVPEKGMLISAYGYNNTDLAADGSGNISSLQDVNRDWDNTFNKNTPMLPVTNFTYDFLNVSGQGIGGTFRPSRNDLSYVSDNYAQNLSGGGSVGLEQGFGNTSETGFNYEANEVTTETKTWTKNNQVISKFSYDRDRQEADYEPYVYKQIGELSVDDEPEYLNSIQNEKAVKIEIEKNKAKTWANAVLIDSEGNDFGFNGKGYRAKRVKRNQTLTITTQRERVARGDKGLQELGYVPDHHPSEVAVTRNDGARYIYGIPAYNRTQEQTTFSVGLTDDVSNSYRKNKSTHEAKIDQVNGTYLYSTSSDNSMDNENGDDHFYSNTILPEYAHSYLLTTVLSPDYIDSDKTEGPSDYDIGNYTRFEYDKLPELYKWRSPFNQAEANYTEGLKSVYTDDKANYVYGEKELWFLKKIESKNSVAIFHTSARHDGYGVMDKNGGIGDISTMKLDKISLYSKIDYTTNGANAVPIKEIHFEYDYSLCPAIDNNDGIVEMVNGTDINLNKGKLTLKKVYFTYGTSNLSKFSPYTFNYSEINPNYGLKNYDRWGNYKPNQLNSDLFSFDKPMVNSEFPYCEQDRTLADDYASAWTLTSINLPSGGKISVDLEADDYAYVQDRTALEMFKIEETGETLADLSSGSAEDKLIDTDGLDKNYLYLKFKLKHDLPVATTDAEFQAMYTEKLGDLYFKCLTDITGRGNYEYVSGFCEIENSGLISNGGSDFEYGWVKIKTVNKTEAGISKDVNPISKAAWTFGLNAMPKQVIGKDYPDRTGLGDFLRFLSDAIFIKGLTQFFKGPMNVIKSNGGGINIALSKSMIRLYSPDKKKIGGGLRVKKITVSDEWSSMASPTTNSDQIVGTEYFYTTTDKNGKEISSGVAAWEPAIGGDENPFKLPIYMGDKDSRINEIRGRDYLVGPIGESFYPSASVGYSKVTVRSLKHENINRHATGKTVHEFYTAKEYPVIVENTGITPLKSRTPGIFKPLSVYSRDHMAVSQGYSIQVNDMHGKPKSQHVYQEGKDDAISGVEYKYLSKIRDEDLGTRELTNSCTIVRPDGTNEERNIGVNIDFVMDFREQKTLGIRSGVSPNLNSFIIAFFPGVVPSLYPSIGVDDTKFRSAVATKVVRRSGILSETIVYDLGSEISTQNLAYDSETGLVLLTKTKNEFDDDIYSFNYPAHWYYDGMGQAYKNLGIEFDNVSFSSGVLSGVANADSYFVEGDEVLLNNKEMAWVSEVSGGNVKMIKKAGSLVSGSYNTLKIVRSGRKNVIGLGMGTLVTMSNPLPNLRNNSFKKVLHSSTQEFKDEWDTFCDCFENSNSEMLVTSNPFLTGIRGNWRPYKSYAYLTPRKHTWVDKSTNIREDGVYTKFNPFWSWIGDSWGITKDNWTWSSEITHFSPYGAELENMDALYRYSSALYGYTKTIPTAAGSNTQYREMAFDGFEDYAFPGCNDDHFSFRETVPTPSDEESHTGSKSLKVSSGTPKKVHKNLEDCEE